MSSYGKEINIKLGVIMIYIYYLYGVLKRLYRWINPVGFSTKGIDAVLLLFTDYNMIHLHKKIRHLSTGKMNTVSIKRDRILTTHSVAEI